MAAGRIGPGARRLLSSTRLPHDVLGLHKDATLHDVKDTFHRLAQRLHPDHDNTPGAEERFAELQIAYHALLSEAGGCQGVNGPYSARMMEAIKRARATAPSSYAAIFDDLQSCRTAAGYVDKLEAMIVSLERAQRRK